MTTQIERVAVPSLQVQPVAEAVATSFEPAPGAKGLMLVRGSWWKWHESGRWTRLGKEELKRELWRVLATVGVDTSVGNSTGWKPFQATRGSVADVMESLEAICEVPWKEEARWIGEDGPPCDPRFAILFRDKVVDVKGTAQKGQWVTYDRDWRWFGSYGLTVEWKPEAKAETWVEGGLKVWGEGEEAWGELLERFAGAILMPWRKWKVWLLQYGVANGGKGVFTNEVLKPLMAGGYMGVEMETAMETHMGAAFAGEDVVVFADVGEMGDRDRGRFGGLLRRLMGGDDQTTNPKNREAQKGVVWRAMPIVQSHYLLDLPNEQGGLGSKMLPLHYRKVLGRLLDGGFGDKLRGELDGIAYRFAEAAVRLVSDMGTDRQWPITDSSKVLKRRVEIESNPADAFLEWGFNFMGQGFVAGTMVKAMRKEFEERHGIRMKKNGKLVPDLRLLGWLEEANSRGVRHAKRVVEGNTWGLSGVVVKSERE